MKIGIDLRFYKNNDAYSDFVLELIKNMIKFKKEDSFIVYLNEEIDLGEFNNLERKIVKINLCSLKENLSFNKILKHDNNSLVIFFNGYKPILYNKDYLLIIESLKNVLYQDFSSTIQKYKYSFLINNSIKNASKIICHDEGIKNEIIEKFCIEDRKINVILPFFPNNKEENKSLEIDLKKINNIKNDYLIYPGGYGIEKNLDKLINSFSILKKENIKLDLILFGEEIETDLSIRNLIIKKGLQDNIHFMGAIDKTNISTYYKQSIGVIYPSMYESFPFELEYAVYLNSRIISSDLDCIKNIFNDKISYFSPNSTTNISENIKLFINNKNEINYNEVRKNITKENTIQSLFKII